ncbi:MAG: ATP-binding protein [Alkalilacustris sp.]
MATSEGIDAGKLLAAGRFAGFDRLADMAARSVAADVALLSLIDESGARQVFLGRTGLREPWSSLRCTPLSHSFCRHVVCANAPLRVEDARTHPALAGNPAITDLGVTAYLGYPVRDPAGTPVAALCAISATPRAWTAAEADIIADFAALAEDQLALTLALRASDARLRAEHDLAAAKARFLAVMSHEIRTPLGGVLGMAELLLEGPLTAEQAGIARSIQTSGEDLLLILNDLLDMARIGAGKLTVETAPFSLRAMLDGVVLPAAALARDKGIALQVACPEEAELADRRLGDRLRVSQILGNLLSNAVKFTGHGEVLLRVAGGPDALEFEVRDTGIGMDEAQVARLFLPFEQADASIARRFGGTGLGMSIVHSLVQLLGGRITVSSRPGAGTRVSLCLPLPRAVAGTCASSGASSDATPITMPLAPRGAGDAPCSVRDRQDDPGEATATDPPALDGVRVLVADDNATNRRLLAILLERAGARAEVVEDGRAAVAAAARSGSRPGDGPRLILLDISMPGLDGRAALRAIRAEEAAQGRRPVPAVAVTANATAEQRQACLDAGFVAVVAKPFSARALIVVLGEALAHAEGADPPVSGMCTGPLVAVRPVPG